MERHDVVVVGAGITGLSAAWELHRAGLDVLLVEADERVGGVIRSEEVPGVGVIDLGPQTVRSRDADLFRHFAELGIEAERLVAGSQGKSRYVVLDGELVELPQSPPALVSSRLLSFGAKMRLLTEPLRATHPDEDESIREFFTRRLGPEVAERLVDPFVSGVYAGDPGRLSMEAVFPELKAGVDERGSLLRWGLARMRGGREEDGEGVRPGGADGGGPADGKRSAELFSFPDGLERWPRAIAEGLGASRVRLGHRTVAAEHDAGHDAERAADSAGADDADGAGWVVRMETDDGPRTVRCRSLILTVPAPVVGEILGRPGSAVDSEGGRGKGGGGLADIPYSPVTTVHTAYAREDIDHPLAGFGFLCPSRERRKALGVLWISSLFPERVEDDRVLLTTFVGGARQPERAFAPEEDLIELACAEHRHFLGAAAPPVYARVRRWERAIPQYEFGHLERVAEADRLEAELPGLHLAGAWRDGVSVTDCWEGGRRVARAAGRSAVGDPEPAAADPTSAGGMRGVGAADR